MRDARNQTRFQSVEVDSIAAIVTPSSRSHSRTNRRDPVVVLNVRVS